MKELLTAWGCRDRTEVSMRGGSAERLNDDIFGNIFFYSREREFAVAMKN
jgi:hypothetical protein